jgi:hypothetical protein
MNDANTRPFYYSQVRVHPRNPDRVWFSSTPVLVSNDGGIAITNDNGGSWDFAAMLPLAQPYEVSYDFAFPYNICGGMQDNGSWCGPSRRKNGPVTNAFWFTFNGGDGFYTAQHPLEPHMLFGESQGGNMARYNRLTGERTALVKPSWRPRYTQFEDSILIERGDTARPASRDQERRITELRNRQRADSAEFDIRWNWNTPFLLSPHNPDVFYAAGNRVMKSTQRGDNLFPISPDLSRKQMAKIDTSMRKTGGITLDATGAETYGTVVALAESYVRPGFPGRARTTATSGSPGRTGRHGRPFPPRDSRDFPRATSTSPASSPRISIHSRRTWRSTTIAGMISRRICTSPRMAAAASAPSRATCRAAASTTSAWCARTRSTATCCMPAPRAESGSR